MNLRRLVVSIISVSLLSAGLGAGPLAVLPVAIADPADNEPPFDRGPVDSPTVDARPLGSTDPVPDAADQVTGLTGDVELPDPAAAEVTVDETWTDVSGMPVEIQVDGPVDPETPETPEDGIEPGDTVEVALTRPPSLDAGLLLHFETTDAAEEPAQPAQTPEPSQTPAPSDPTPDPGATPEPGEPAAEETDAPIPTNPTSDPTGDPTDLPEDPADEPVAADDVQVRISYAGFANAFGGGWADRLQVRAYPACFADTPEDPACATGVPVEATNDPETQELTFTTIPVSEIDAAGTDDDAGVAPSARNRAAAGPAESAESLESPVFLLAAGPGNYAAKPISPSAGWQVGPGSGEFGYSYPFELPPATTGSTPSLSINYASSAVDGAPSQASPVGLGWADLSPGYITRSYMSCDDDRKNRKPGFEVPGEDKDDLCWRTRLDDEGLPTGEPVQEYTLVLNGKSSPLIKTSESPGGQRTRYRLRDDSGWRVTRYEIPNPGTGEPDNADNDNEAFTVETPDGTEYWFGLGLGGTNSVWTVPVFGNDAGEECHDTDIDDSWCQQGWRWNLDRVTNTLTEGNQIRYTYTTEANNYLRWGTTKTPYDRAGALEKVEYGFAQGSGQPMVAHQEVDVDTDDRCTPKIEGGSDCTPDPGENAWPDVPQDLVCEGSQTCTGEAPALFTDQRYTKVTTRTYEGTDPGNLTMRVVDEYVLEHTMPDPDGTGPTDPGLPELWLNEVTRTGTGAGGTTPLPPVQFDNGPVANTLDGLVVAEGDWTSRRFRINSLRNETGGRIEVEYGHAANRECDPNYVDPPTEPPLEAWESTKECFGQMWVPPGEEEDELGWFHKYVVTRLALSDDALGYSLAVENEVDPTSLGSLRVYDYTYTGIPAWRYVPSLNTLNADETWTDFRGYGVTNIFTRNVEDQDVMSGNKSWQRIVRYRGMTGSPSSGPVGPGSPRWGDDDWRLETDEPGDGSPGPVDEKWLNGLTAETSLLKPNGDLINRSYTAYDTVQTAEDIDGDRQARIRFATSSTTTTAVTGSPDRTRTMTYTVDDGGSDPMSILVGTVLRTEDHVANASGGQPDYANEPDTCTTTGWIADTGAEAWIRKPTTTRMYESTCAALDPEEDEPLTDTLNLYDGSAADTQTLSQGLWTGVDTATGTGDPIETRTEYDGYGRVTAVIDGNGNRTEADFGNPGSTDPTHDLATRVTATDPKTFTTVTDLDPRRGLPTTITDANSKTTELDYNGLGQPTKVFLPEHPVGVASIEYVYDTSASAPSRVETRTLRSGSSVFDNTYEFYDGWGRPVESQVLVPKNGAPPAIPELDGRIVSATGYDEQGQVRYSMPAMANTEEDFSEVLNADPDNVVRYTETSYDAANRPTTVEEKSFTGVENSVTSDYFGDRVESDPLVGGDTVTFVDHRGRTNQVQLMTGSNVTDQAKYLYTPTGQLEDITKDLDVDGDNVIDPGGAETFHWQYGYDMAGRRIWADDPDTDSSITHYDANSNIITAITAKNINFPGGPYDPVPSITYATIETTFDELNRPLERSEPSLTPLLTEWTYDDPAVDNSKGQLTAIAQDITNVNTTGGGNPTYITRVDDYDARGNPLSTTDEYPTWLTGEASGTGGAPAGRVAKTTTYTYNQADQVITTTYPEEAGLASQTVTTDYTTNGVLKEMVAKDNRAGAADQLLAWQSYNNIGQINGLYSSNIATPALLRQYSFYPETGRIHTLLGSDKTGTLWFPLAFEYDQDANGNPTRIRGAIQNNATDPQKYGAWCYSYDALQRLDTVRVGASPTQGSDCTTPTTTSNLVTGTPYQLDYDYDADRLETVKTTATTPVQTVTYGFDPDAPHQTTSITGTGTAAGLPSRSPVIQYDLGRVIRANYTGTLNQTVYHYNKLQQLESMTIGLVGNTQNYAYHADGTRLARRHPTTGTVVYRTDGTELTKAGSTFTAVRNFSTPDGVPVASRTTGTSLSNERWTWLMTDAQGTLRLTKNHAGVYARFNYLPHGGPTTGATAGQPATPGNRGYLDKPHDPNGDIRLDQRHYTPTFNILTTPDPIFEPGDPQSANPYAYARNNPITFADGSGLKYDAPMNYGTSGANVPPCIGAHSEAATEHCHAGEPVENPYNVFEPELYKQAAIDLKDLVVQTAEDTLYAVTHPVETIETAVNDIKTKVANCWNNPSYAGCAPLALDLALTVATGGTAKGLLTVRKVRSDGSPDAPRANDSPSPEAVTPTPRNAHLAGGVHPVTGVPFDERGFPDFAQWRHSDVPDVNITPTGTRAGDFAKANQAAGLDRTPAGYTWHHHQDHGRMQLIDRGVHAATGHTGGFSIWGRVLE